MLGFQSPVANVPVQPAQPADAAQPTPPTAPAQKPLMQTMLGFAAPNLGGSANAAAPTPTPPPAPASPIAASTMLGMASPLAGMPAPAPTAAQPPAAAPVARFGGTMLGVAMPGIAPAHSQPGVAPPPRGPAFTAPVAHEPLPEIVAAPAPFARGAAPAAPIIVKRRGIPIAVFAVFASLVVLGGGAAILFFARGAPPLVASAKASADGKEQLHLRCESCPNGTTVTWQGSKATFANREADLDLPTPLVIGDNAFQIAIDRPGTGRDETVKIVLPVAYRIRGDLSDIAADKPAIKVDVEAQKGARVTVDAKPVELDANGKAVIAYDVSSDVTGPADETKTIEKKIPYEVEGTDHKKSNGEVVVRVAVLPLHVDAPGSATLWTQDAQAWIAGRTAKGALVTANGAPLVLAPDGSFEGKVDVASGEQTITVRAADPNGKAAPRASVVRVNRVAQLAAQGKAFDKTATSAFEAFTNDASLGQPAVVVGTVGDVRAAHHHVVMVVDDKRCAKPPCLVRVEYGTDSAVRPNDTIVAYGMLAKPVTTPDGKTLPALDASYVREAQPNER